MSKIRVFELANDPADLRTGPVILDGPHDGQGMRGVTQGRQPEDADGVRLVIKWQQLQFRATKVELTSIPGKSTIAASENPQP